MSASVASRPCGICATAMTAPPVVAAERMLGLGEEFRYDRCDACGCVQLRDIPADMRPYYGPGYYSLEEPAPAAGARRLYRRIRDALLFGRLRLPGAIVAPLLPRRIAEVREWFRRTNARSDARILDVGCGIGLLLRRLADQGFHSAFGVDPFIAENIRYGGRTLVRRGELRDVTGPFDLVMLHHSLEHMPAQRETMRRVAELLRPGGFCLVRIPIVGTTLSEEYGDRWVQLDAPRHFFLHSENSLRQLATEAGLDVVDVVHDATWFSLAGSEMYRRDLPLASLETGGVTPAQRRAYERRARQLNAMRQGDQAAFYLRKPAPGPA